jgi:hypothetical protein
MSSLHSAIASASIVSASGSIVSASGNQEKINQRRSEIEKNVAAARAATAAARAATAAARAATATATAAATAAAATAAATAVASECHILVSSNNLITTITTMGNGESEADVKKRLTVVDSRLPNVVFKNGAIVYTVIGKDQCEGKWKLDTLPIPESESSRFISSETFEALDCKVTLHQPVENPTILFYVRHTTGWHNVMDSRKRNEWLRENPDELAKYLEMAKKDSIDVSALDLAQQLQVAEKYMLKDSDLTPQGEIEAATLAPRIQKLIRETFPGQTPFLRIGSSELFRARKSAAILARNLGYNKAVWVFPFLNETVRAVGATHHEHGSVSWEIARSLNRSTFDYATTVLKTTFVGSQDDWRQAPHEVTKPIIEEVQRLLDENTPLHQSPYKINGISFVRPEGMKATDDFADVWDYITKHRMFFLSGNKIKQQDLAAAGVPIPLVSADIPEIQGTSGDVAKDKSSYMCDQLGMWDVAKLKSSDTCDQLGMCAVTEDTSLNTKNGGSLGPCIKHVIAAIKPNVEAGTTSLPLVMKTIDPTGKFFTYTSIVSSSDGPGSKTILFESTALGELHHIPIEELRQQKIPGDIDPYFAPTEVTLVMRFEDGTIVPIWKEVYDNQQGLTIGQLQKLDPTNRYIFHPRFLALEAWKAWLKANGFQC